MTGFVSSENVALDGYILSFLRIWNYFVAEKWIIIGLG